MSCLSLYHDMRVQYVCNHGIRFPGRFFRLLKLRFRPSFFPGSHHVPWQHKYTKCLRKQSQHQVSCFKQQNSSHAHNNSNMRNIAIKPIKNNLNLSSWCLPQICQQLRVLNAFKNVALAIVIERHMTTKRTSNNQKKYADKTISTASVGVSRPLLNSNSMPALSHAVISENNKWTSSWQNQLFSCR